MKTKISYRALYSLMFAFLGIVLLVLFIIFSRGSTSKPKIKSALFTSAIVGEREHYL